MTNPALIMLSLLSLAQHKSGEKSLKGLSHWMALKLLPLLDEMHSRARQHKLQVEMQAAAVKGSLETISDLLLSPRGFEADARDFQRALADYAERKRQIAALQGMSGLMQEAGRKGRGIAQSLAYGICIATVYVTLKSYFNL
jgi:hypothetical protein